MESSLKAFLRGLIDYAGMFPPSGLSLDASIRNFAEYKKCPDAWMLSRFIILSKKLKELQAYDDLMSDGEPFDFSVISQTADTVQSFKEALSKTADEIVSFHEGVSTDVLTGALEVKLPIECIISSKEGLISEALGFITKSMNHAECLPKQVYCEAKLTENWRQEIPVVLKAIANHNAADKSDVRLAFKLRCGGVEAHMFPSVEQVAFVLTQAREANVAMKCTAGLHHPIRHYSESVSTKMHGFFNVFGAGLLGYAHDLNEKQMQAIIRDEDPSDFHFDKSMFSWQDLSIDDEQISELRNVALHSYGSCSFNEPREDLEDLRLLRQEVKK